MAEPNAGTSVLGYDVTGPPAAPVLLLGSSMGTTAAMWDPQVDALSARLRVVRFDHRGHGRSPVPPGPYTIEQLAGDVLALADGLGIERFSYAGVSLGGMVGMWLAAHVQHRLDRLALVCTSAYMPPAEGWLERAKLARDGGVASVADTVLGRWFTPAFLDEPPEIVARLKEGLVATPAEGYASCCEAIAVMDLRPILPRITAPALVVSGAGDPAAPPEHGAQIAAAIPGARLVVVPDAAHLASVEQAEAVTALLVQHFAGAGQR
jgi:3-oxoadipate enol-lactonase